MRSRACTERLSLQYSPPFPPQPSLVIFAAKPVNLNLCPYYVSTPESNPDQLSGCIPSLW